jgi:DNA (cytosine-5)-methyltransferase 1
MDPDDPRSKHVLHFLEIVEFYEPTAFCMENVRPLARGERWSAVREQLRQRAHELGYEFETFVLNAADYGVPQARERMFLIGLRGGAPLRPVRTTATRLTVRDALRDLPRFGQPGNDSTCPARVVPAPKPVMRPSPYRGSLLFNGSGRVFALDEPARTLPASMGGNATPIIDQLELEEGKRPWVVGYHARLRSGRSPLEKAPSRMRRLTIEEAAALQTFPPSWVFAGASGSRYRQIGNAVPPRLALAVARSLHDALEALCAGEAKSTERHLAA